jgi:hypothetical protein
MATIMRRNPPGASEQFCPNRAGYEIIDRPEEENLLASCRI